MNVTQEKRFAEWVGQQSESVDTVSDRLVQSFKAIFDPHLAAVPAGLAPLGVHWCLSPTIAGMDQLGPDGHPSKNLNLPPVPLPRRMWAGGELQVHELFRIGDQVCRVSTILDITRKQGRSGELWFVVVGHDYLTGRGLAVRERQDIVYRQSTPLQGGVHAVHPKVEPTFVLPAGRSFSVVPTTTLLFRYSALTFNGHRIHYDLPYATEAEGYEGLVVHGPLQATLLLNLAASHGVLPPLAFRYRSTAVAIAGHELTFRAGTDGLHFWTQGVSGSVHMEADIDRKLQ